MQDPPVVTKASLHIKSIEFTVLMGSPLIMSITTGVIEEEVYIEQPQVFEVEDRKTHVWKLKKAFYGLKQAPRAWYERIDSFLTSLGFTKSKVDSNLYFKVMNDEPVILLLYVDDLFLTGQENLITKCKKKLVAEF
jgi:hypothetical protein